MEMVLRQSREVNRRTTPTSASAGGAGAQEGLSFHPQVTYSSSGGERMWFRYTSRWINRHYDAIISRRNRVVREMASLEKEAAAARRPDARLRRRWIELHGELDFLFKRHWTYELAIENGILTWGVAGERTLQLTPRHDGANAPPPSDMALVEDAVRRCLISGWPRGLSKKEIRAALISDGCVEADLRTRLPHVLVKPEFSRDPAGRHILSKDAALDHPPFPELAREVPFNWPIDLAMAGPPPDRLPPVSMARGRSRELEDRVKKETEIRPATDRSSDRFRIREFLMAALAGSAFPLHIRDLAKAAVEAGYKGTNAYGTVAASLSILKPQVTSIGGGLWTLPDRVPSQGEQPSPPPKPRVRPNRRFSTKPSPGSRAARLDETNATSDATPPSGVVNEQERHGRARDIVRTMLKHSGGKAPLKTLIEAITAARIGYDEKAAIDMLRKWAAVKLSAKRAT
jgi:hypothetical protein